MERKSGQKEQEGTARMGGRKYESGQARGVERETGVSWVREWGGGLLGKE